MAKNGIHVFAIYVSRFPLYACTNQAFLFLCNKTLRLESVNLNTAKRRMNLISAVAGSFIRPDALPNVRRLAIKIHRSTLPREYKHLAAAGPFVTLGDENNERAGKTIDWKGRAVARTRPLLELKDSCQRNAFLIATGPSLKGVEFSRLKGRVTMGVNGAIAKFASEGFAPDFFTVTDADFFESRFEMIRQTIQSGAKCLFSYVGLSRICQKEPLLLKEGSIYLTEIVNRQYDKPRMSVAEFKAAIHNDPDFVLPDPDHPQDNVAGFSLNIAKGVFCSRTIIFRAIQHLRYIGCPNVFVLGMDLGYRGDHPRFYETTQTMRPSKIEQDYTPNILPAFLALKRYMSQSSFRVYNLSPQSRLPAEVMPRLTLAEALAMDDAAG